MEGSHCKSETYLLHIGGRCSRRWRPRPCLIKLKGRQWKCCRYQGCCVTEGMQACSMFALFSVVLKDGFSPPMHACMASMLVALTLAHC